MSQITIVLDCADAMELGEALIDAGMDAHTSGDTYAVEFVRSMAVSMPTTGEYEVELTREHIDFEIRPA